MLADCLLFAALTALALKHKWSLKSLLSPALEVARGLAHGAAAAAAAPRRLARTLTSFWLGGGGAPGGGFPDVVDGSAESPPPSPTRKAPSGLASGLASGLRRSGKKEWNDAARGLYAPPGANADAAVKESAVGAWMAGVGAD